jgi:diguanylate cyclase (GGDEF)-like protein
MVSMLMKANAQMQSQLQAAEHRMQEQAKEIETHVRTAHTDQLTKLPNRRSFDEELQRCVQAFLLQGQPSCVMMVDVDHFKKFNDTYGHQAGDEVLRNVARVLNNEASNRAVVCRYGGEEFALIFPGMDIQAAIPLAEKARAAVAREVVEYEGLDLRVTASGGLAQLQPAETGEMLVKRADTSLYVCKENGRNCGYWHDGKNSNPMKSAVTATPQPQAAKSPSAAARPAPVQRKPEPATSHSAALGPAPVPVSAPPTESKSQVPQEEAVFHFTPVEAAALHRRDRVANLSDYETFCRDVDRRLAENQREGRTTSLLVLGIDDSQTLVDRYGSKATELALRTTSRVIKAAMRETDHAARGEEGRYVVMLPGAKAQEAELLAERIRSAVEGLPLLVNDEEVTFTVSIGVVEFRAQDEREQVLERANAALAAARQSGGNRTFSESAEFAAAN